MTAVGLYGIILVWATQCHKPTIGEWFFFRTHKNGDVLQNNYGDSIIVLCSPVIPGVCTSTSSGDATSKHEILKSDFGSISIHISRYCEYIYR